MALVVAGSPRALKRPDGRFKLTEDGTAEVGAEYARTRSGNCGWMLEPYATDPSDDRLYFYNGLNAEESANLDEIQGIPDGHYMKGKSHYQFHDKKEGEDSNAQMMQILRERDFSDMASPKYKAPSQVQDDRKTAFGMFQHVVKEENQGFLHAFDLPCALEAAGFLGIGDQQPVQLRENFGLLPGDRVSYDQFNHMCDLVLENQQRPDEPFDPPGSPRYEKGGGPKQPPPVNKPGKMEWHKKQGDKIDVPANVRSEFYFQGKGEV